MRTARTYPCNPTSVRTGLNVSTTEDGSLRLEAAHCRILASTPAPTVHPIIPGVPCFVPGSPQSYALAGMTGTILTHRAQHGSLGIAREIFSADYAALSTHTRNVMRQAAVQRIEAGDTLTRLVEGLDLCGQDDADAFQEGVHPTDLGFARIADRLLPTIRDVLSEARPDL